MNAASIGPWGSTLWVSSSGGAAHVRSRQRRFSAGMAAADHHHIEMLGKIHITASRFVSEGGYFMRKPSVP